MNLLKEEDIMDRLKMGILAGQTTERTKKKDECKREFGEGKKENINLVRLKINLEELNEELGEQLDKEGISRPDNTELLKSNKRAVEMQKRALLQQKQKAIEERKER